MAIITASPSILPINRNVVYTTNPVVTPVINSTCQANIEAAKNDLVNSVMNAVIPTNTIGNLYNNITGGTLASLKAKANAIVTQEANCNNFTSNPIISTY